MARAMTAGRPPERSTRRSTYIISRHHRTMRKSIFAWRSAGAAILKFPGMAAAAFALANTTMLQSAPGIAAETVTGYPSRPIRLVLGFPPGGSADALARIIGPRLSEAMGAQWVIDNRGGAAGNLATEIVARAQPDGYTLLLGLNTSLAVNPSLYGKLPFNVLRDLQPIVTLTSQDHILAVHAASVAATSVKELVALAKAKPAALNYSTSGIGSTPHMAAELFNYMAGTRMVHVPYKGGGPAVAALLAGEAQVMFGTTPSLLPYVKSGRLRALATTGSKRSAVVPELPTISEAGYPGYEMIAWLGLLAPARTPDAIIQLLYVQAVKAMGLPEVQKALSAQGFETLIADRVQFRARIEQETKTWTKVIKAAGIRVE